MSMRAMLLSVVDERSGGQNTPRATANWWEAAAVGRVGPRTVATVYGAINGVREFPHTGAMSRRPQRRGNKSLLKMRSSTLDRSTRSASFERRVYVERQTHRCSDDLATHGARLVGGGRCCRDDSRRLA